MKTIKTLKYKGHKIAVMDSVNQRFFIVDNDFTLALWSLSDAKRFIRGEKVYFEPVNVAGI